MRVFNPITSIKFIFIVENRIQFQTLRCFFILLLKFFKLVLCFFFINNFQERVGRIVHSRIIEVNSISINKNL